MPTATTHPNKSSVPYGLLLKMFRAVGFLPVNPVLINNYTWSYDNAGRLTSEVLDSSDNSLDQTESYIMDLVGNRIRRTIDKPGTVNDVTDIYTFNSSDQLQSENRVSGLFPTGTPTGSSLQSTAYTWSGTQQASKAVSIPSTSTVTQSMTYGLTGQLEGVITETKNGSNAVTARTQVEYRYDNSGLRFIAIDSTDSNLTTPGIERTENGRTEYLLDHANMTGYGQTIIETVKNALGQATKRTSYTIGTDEITQTVSTLDPATGNVTASETLTFGHDGHGSTRVLFGAAAAIVQVFTYSAYGELLAIHNGAGVRDATYGGTASTLANPAGAKTSLLYNGESLDSRTGLYNNRDRWLDVRIGRFISCDRYAGNPNNPFSFNKTAYTSGDPVQFNDPTGLFDGLGGLLGSLAIGGLQRGLQVGAVGAATGALLGGIDAYLAGESVTKGALNGAKWGGAIGFGFGFLAPFATTFLSAPILSALANLGAGASLVIGALGASDSFDNGNVLQGVFRMGLGFVGFAGLRYSAVRPTKPVNIGGEGEVPGIINLQGLWALSKTYGRSQPTPKGEAAGKSLAGMILEGHEFSIYNAAKGKLPYADNSVPKVYTNSIPIDRSGGIYPSVASDEIKRVLVVGGQWIRDGVVVFTKSN